VSTPLAVVAVLFLQAVAQPLAPPDLQPNVNLWGVLAWAALNPAVMAVGYVMGRKADQAAKIGLAGFVAALAGVALLWVAARLHMGFAIDTARAAAGVFMMAWPFGALWAWVGRRSAAAQIR
jgi:hypothetical protein